MLHTRTSRWALGTAVLCLILLVVAWLLLISPRRSQAADLSDQEQTTLQQNSQLQTRIEELKAQSAQLATYRSQLSGILQQLPPTAQMPQLVRDLSSLAEASGVSLDTVTPSGATTLTVPGTSGGASTAKPTGVVQIPMALIVHGDYFQTMAFLQKLQTQLTRAFLITGAAVAPGSSGGSGQIQLSLTGAVFVWPTGASATATATAAHGATTPGTTTSGTVTSGTVTSGTVSSPTASATTGATP